MLHAASLSCALRPGIGLRLDVTYVTHVTCDQASVFESDASHDLTYCLTTCDGCGHCGGERGNPNGVPVQREACPMPSPFGITVGARVGTSVRYQGSGRGAKGRGKAIEEGAATACYLSLLTTPKALLAA